ncbi:MAG: hypothetical protein WCE53_04695 [Candidatus Acidiferrum sp.]
MSLIFEHHCDAMGNLTDEAYAILSANIPQFQSKPTGGLAPLSEVEDFLKTWIDEAFRVRESSHASS